MKKFLLLLSILISTTTFANPNGLQNDDFKTAAELVSGGSTAASLLNADRIWDEVHSQQLSVTLAGSGSGTVTSVAFSVPGSSIFGSSGSPITTSGTLAFSVAGTSGGIPYFDTTSTLSSSAALTNHALVLGGGAGAAPTVLGSLGTTTTVLHGNASGAPSFGAVSLTADVSGVLPVANGGTNSSTSLSNNRVIQSSGGAIVEAAAITAARALISDANGIPTQSAVTSTELGYVSGVTSAIQTQINGKMASFTWQQETPSGTIDGSNAAFTLAHTPSAAFSVELMLDGLVQTQGAGKAYTISGTTITFATAPAIGQVLWAKYTY